MQGRIHSTESFGSVDGPGVRFVIFFKGCAMRCRYCHNPDTWGCRGGELKTAAELLDRAERYRSYWGKEGGITVSGGEPLLQIDFLLELFREAKKRGITVSCDLNYRKNLWTEAEAKACMTQLMPYIDILVANEEDADKVLGIKARDTDVTQGKLNREGYVDVAEQICQTYGTKMVAVTLRRSISASDNEWSAMLYTGGKPYFSRQYMIRLVDRVGGGDSFTAGLLYGVMNDYGPQETIEYAAAASCLKHSIEMDFNLSTVAEVERLVRGDGSGRVQR